MLSTLRRSLAVTAALAAASSLLWAPLLPALALCGTYAAPLALWAHRRSFATRACAQAVAVLLAPGSWVLAPFALVPLVLGPWHPARRTPPRPLALAAIAVAFAAGVSAAALAFHPAAALVASFAILAVTPADRRLAACASTTALSFAILAPVPVSARLALVGAALLALPLRLVWRRPRATVSRTTSSRTTSSRTTSSRTTAS